MANHQITIVDREITIDDGIEIVQNGIGKDAITIIKDAEWNSLSSITVVFENEDIICKAQLTDSSVVIPWEVLQNEGYLYISVVGYDSEDNRIITKQMSEPFIVVKSGAVDGPVPGDPTLSELITIRNECAEYAQEAQEAASSITIPIPISSGGTGGTTSVSALNNLGISWGTSEAPSTGTPNTIYIQML